MSIAKPWVEMNDPLISVIIPACNASKWIVGTVGSVSHQTWRNLEVIIVNDGSTDDTSAVARSIADPRVIVVDQPNAGVSAARNTGIEKARGELISFLDADDAMHPEDLQRKFELLESSGCDWVFGDLRMCDEHLRPTGEIQVATDDDVVDTILLGGGKVAVPAPCSNLVARRRCFEQGIRFDPDLSNAADQHMALQLASRHTYAHLPAALNDYRVLKGSMSRNIGLYEKDHLLLFKRAEEMGLLRDPAFKRKCLANAYWSIAGSWWVQGNEKTRGLRWMMKAMMMDPGVILKKAGKRIAGTRQAVPLRTRHQRR